MIQFPTLEEALELHQNLIQHFGGTKGIRDPGLLESALFRPQTVYYKDLAQMAAALMESLLLNHPFFDGTKRTAFFLTDIFLRMNGWKIKIEPQVGYHFIKKNLTGAEVRLPQIDKWIRKHLRRLRSETVS